MLHPLRQCLIVDAGCAHSFEERRLERSLDGGRRKAVQGKGMGQEDRKEEAVIMSKREDGRREEEKRLVERV